MSVCLFSLVIVPCSHNTNSSHNHKDANREEEPKETLGIVTELATIIFFVVFTDFITLIEKHGINLQNMPPYIYAVIH